MSPISHSTTTSSSTTDEISITIIAATAKKSHKYQPKSNVAAQTTNGPLTYPISFPLKEQMEPISDSTATFSSPEEISISTIAAAGEKTHKDQPKANGSAQITNGPLTYPNPFPLKEQMAPISNSTTIFSSPDEISFATIAATEEKKHKDQPKSNRSAHATNGPLTYPNPLPLKDRVAIVTGGSGGIGSEISIHLAILGARIIVSYLGDSTPADTVLSSINSLSLPLSPPRAIKVETDVSDEAQVKALFDRAQQAFGPTIHIVVATAGVQDPTYPNIVNTSLSQWETVFNVNAKGTFLCCREAARRLVRGGGGRIITMSSSTVGSIRPGYGSYSATKAAIEVMTRVMAKELKGTGITANAVAPGPINTAMFYAGKTEEKVNAVVEMSPMGRLGEPRDVAPMVGFLASDAGEWVNGQVIRINGGYV